MDDKIKIIEDFVEIHKKDIVKNKTTIDIDFNEFAKFDIDLAQNLLDNPETFIEEFNFVISRIYDKTYFVKFFNLPKSSHLKIASIRKEDIGKFWCFEGIVSRITDVIINTVTIKYECPNCGNTMWVHQTGDKKIVPDKCGCGRKGKLRIIEEKLEDIQKIMLEDFVIEREGTYKPIMKMVRLKEHLTNPTISKQIQPGTHINVIGILKTKEINKEGLEKDFYIDANNIIIKDKSLYSITLTKKDIENVKKLSKDPHLLEKLSQSISPGTEGMENEKKALVIQHFRADNIYDESGKLDDRGTINIAMIGPPGSNKTYIAKKAISLNPISLFTSGKGISGVGLVAAVSFDKVLNCWTLDPGAVPICNKGIILIDECDKINTEDIGYLNNAMNDLECYDSETEILTKKGWQFFKDVKKNETVATLNSHGFLEYHPVDRYIKKDYIGKLIDIKNRQINLSITPNHNIYTSLRKWGPKYKPFKLYPFSKVSNKILKFKKNCKWKGKFKEFFEIPSIKKFKNQNSKGIIIPSKRVCMDTWLEFMGWFISEGSINKTNNIPYYTILSQKKDKLKILKIKNCLNRLGFKYSYKNGNFIICNKQLAYYCSKFGKAINKYVPQFVKELPPKQIKIFLDSLFQGDGYVRGKRIGFCSISKKLVDGVQELLLKIGFSANIKKIHPKDTKIGKRIISKENKQPIYTINVNKSHNFPVINHHQTKMPNQINKRDYMGKVYCVNVQNNLIYVRKEGIPVWCGNCPINKANVRAILETDVSFLCCANPQYRVFDVSIEKFRQLGLPPDFLDRFDLVFAIESSGEEKERKNVIRKIIKRYKGEVKAEIDPELFTKYVAYAWQNIHPEIDDSLVDYLEKKIDEIIDPSTKKKTEISVRIVGTILRLSKAIARMYYSHKVRHKDVDLAIDLLLYSFKGLEMMDETLKITIESFQRKTEQKKIKAHHMFLELLGEEGKVRDELLKSIPDITESEFEELVTRLKKSGDIFEPKRNFFKRI